MIKTHSAKIEFTKDIEEDIYGKKVCKTFTTYIIVNGDDRESILDLISDKMEELEPSIEFARCPDEMSDGYCDGFTLNFIHGEFGNKKSHIKEIFKQAKKELNIK